MQSANRDNFFQSEAAQASQARKAAKADNKNGDPIQMKSKILAAIPDPLVASDSSDALESIFIAESAGFVRRVRLATGKTHSSYSGPQAPVTCVTTAGGNVFAGCWDKDIWAWNIDSGQQTMKLSGHSDFVKTIVATKLNGKNILLSGGADQKIFVWDLESGRRLHTLQDPSTTMLAIQHIAVDPLLSTQEELIFASASSDKAIRRWRVTASSAEQLTESFVDRPDAERLTIEEHETSVYKLFYDVADDEVNLWTASADGTAKCLSRARNFVADDTFEHGDYVRAVVVTDDWVITAGRSEDIKFWNRSSGKLHCTLEGHFEEVTDLVLLRHPKTGHADAVCSVSIDGTIRKWPLTKKELDETVEKIKAAAKPKEEEKSGEGLMTAEEEAELAELMDD